MSRKKKYATEEERKQAQMEASKRYRETHKVERAKYDKQYYQDNKTEISARKKQWHTDNREEKAAYNKQYNASHKEELAAYRKQYRLTQFGRAFHLLDGYRASDKKCNRGECTIDADWIVKNVFSGQVCHYCGESDWTKLGVDRKDSSLPHTPENCVPCCKSCNNKKHTTSYEEFMDKIQREAS